MANGNGKQQRNHWTVEQKTTAKYLALRYGVPEASRLTTVPEMTIYQQLWAEGGIKKLKAQLVEQTEASLAAAEQEIFQEITRRAAKMTDEELSVNFRKVVELHYQLAKELQQPSGQPLAQAGVTLIQIGTGSPKKLEELTAEELADAEYRLLEEGKEDA